MKFDQSIQLKDLAAFLGREYEGPENHEVTGINEIHKVEFGDIVFVDHPKYFNKALNSAATTILITEKVDYPKGKAIILSPTPFDDFNKIVTHHRVRKTWEITNSRPEIHPSAAIFPNVSIGNNVTIGANSKICAGAVICDNTHIGEDVVIGPNAVIGHDAFYYKKKPEGFIRLETCGRTLIEDRVEIGACTTIDCGVSGDTIIGAGTKIDNHVHVGHDTVIGKNCLFAAHVGIAGCVIIEDHVTLWGQVGIASDVRIGEGATLLAQTGTNKDLEGGRVYWGAPATDARLKMREVAAIKKLPLLLEKL
ncbi:MAG: LpxD N-terminal domain-containing protein [Crocinitomicaceae bacterium]